MAVLAANGHVPVLAQEQSRDDSAILNGRARTTSSISTSGTESADAAASGLRGPTDIGTQLARNPLETSLQQEVLDEVLEADPLTGTPLPAPIVVEDIPRPDLDPYAPLGFRIGSFLLYPQIETGIDFTDNVFLTNTDRESDRTFFYEPRLTFNSTWSRHELSGEVSGRQSYHERFSSEDDREFLALLRGRLDVTERTNVSGELLHAVTQEDRDDFGFPTGAVTRADITTDSAALEGSHTFNRIIATLRGSVTQEDYGELQLVGGGEERGDSRDNTIHATGSRLSYAFRPDLAAFVDWEVNDRRFRQKVSSEGLRNGSSGYEVQAGLAFAMTDILTGEISAGYAHQGPDDPTREVIEGFILNADLNWHVTALTTINFNARSEIDATTIDASGSFSRDYAIGIEHALRRNIIVGAALAYGTEIDADTDEKTRDWTTTLTAEYQLNRSVGLRAAYVYTDSKAETAADSYTENAVTLAVTVRH